MAHPDGKPAWFDGESFVAAKAFLRSSGMVELLVDRQSGMVAADQVEESGFPAHAETIRAFLDAGGALEMLKEEHSVARPG